jgi:hypothetical protein
LWIEYLMLGPWFAQDKFRAKRWRKNIFDRLAWVARYAHVPPSECIVWERADLNDFMQAVHEILVQENKPAKGGRRR